jgi:hypothetical protein
MTSCAEAKYFQKNCTDADLEIDTAGVPCSAALVHEPQCPMTRWHRRGHSSGGV